MILYLLIFFIPIIIYYSNEQQYSYSVKFLILYISLLCVFVGIADMLGGYDRYIYAELFDDVANNIHLDRTILRSGIFQQYPKELGYDFLNVLIGIITTNRYIFILILTIIIYSLTFISFKRYMTNYPFALMVFMALMFFFTFTYLRQILGVSILWLSIKYLLNRKFWKFTLVVFIAFLFHNSAIIFLPVYFIPIKKFSMTQILTVMLLCFVVGLTGLTNALFDAFGGLSGAEERTSMYAEDTSGFRIAYMIEAVFFLYFILRNYKLIPNDKTRIVLFNMSLIFCAVLLFFIKSENGGRLSWFFMIGLISTVTYILTSSKQNFRSSIFMMLVCAFLYIRILTSWGILLYPYKTFFTNGSREGDFIYEHYEYDQGYANDKFYRK